MSNKRFDQFTYGVPGSNDILLWADPSTGEIKKCLKSDLGGSGGGPVAMDKNVVGNTAGVATDIVNMPIPANTITSPGDVLRITTIIQLAAVPVTTFVFVFIGASSWNFSVTSGTGNVKIEHILTAKDLSQCYQYTGQWRGAGSGGSNTGSLFNYNATAIQYLRINVTSATGNAFTHIVSYVEKLT